MIKKWIKSLIEKVFGKFCKCEEKYLADEKAMADYAASFQKKKNEEV